MTGSTSLTNPEAIKAANWLEEVKYTPGSHLRIMQLDHMEPYGGEYGLVLLISVLVKDSYRPEVGIEVAHRKPVWPTVLHSKKAFLDWVAHALEEVAIHESREWFKWRSSDTPVNDPHAAPAQ